MNIICYYRVSTVAQGQSGLGLEAQQSAVENFARQEKGTIVASYREVESGKRCDRPELAKAIRHAKRIGGKLVIAKMDRLARNVHFVSGLMEAGVDFVAVDNPTANRLTIHILAAVAEDEARRISDRTKAALAAYKARGGTLGNTANLSNAGRLKGSQAARIVRRKRSDEGLAEARGRAAQLRSGGLSLALIGRTLADEGIQTATGLTTWRKSDVCKLLKRVAV